MTHAITILSAACLGALLFFLERNDTTERIGPLKMTSGPWTIATCLIAGAMIALNDVDWWRQLVAFGRRCFT